MYFCWWWILSTFFFLWLEIFLFRLCFWKIFSQNSNRTVFFPCYSKEVISLSCLLHYFLWETFCLHHLCSSICNVFFFFSFWMLLRKIFSLLLVLTSLITMHLDVILFMFSCIWVSLNFLDLWSYRFCQMWNNFCHYLFKYYFCPPLSFRDSNCT